MDICKVTFYFSFSVGIPQLIQLLKSDKDLPDGVFWNVDYVGYHFYRELSEDDEIKQKLEVENAKSLRTIADALRFFKILSIVGLSISALIFIICLFLI